MNGFDETVNIIIQTMALLSDNRTGSNTQYSMQDAGLAAFSVFFMQSPSFLAAQQAMEKRKGHSNSQSLFHVDKIPTTNQIRNLLDSVEPKELFPIYDFILDVLRNQGVLDRFRSVNGTQLIAIDGTWYHCSEKIHCENCSTQTHKNGSTTYYHSAITPVIITPNQKVAIALRPEFIVPQDGDEKQDCEIKAAKRWLENNSEFYSTGNDTLLGDDLYSRQPFCRKVLLHGYHFIFVCKPTSHTHLYEWLELLEAGIDRHTQTKRIKNKGKWETHTVHYANNVPLIDAENALRVNWVEHTIEINGKQTYKNAFATDHAVNSENALEIATEGRSWDEIKISEEAALDGCYIIRTDVPTSEMETKEVVKAYKSLGEVERAFRNLKTVQLDMRPVYHKSDDRIRAHVFLCTLAYYVQWHMQQRLKPLFERDGAGDQREWTFDGVINRLKQISRHDITAQGVSFQQDTQPDEKQREIIELLSAKSIATEVKLGKSRKPLIGK
jgi:hypothetical protein